MDKKIRSNKSLLSVGYKSQASVEYMIVIGFSLLLIISISYYFFFYKTTADKDVVSSQIELAGNAMVKNAEDIYFSTGATKKQIELTFPPELMYIYTQNKNKELVLELDNRDKKYFYSKVPIFVLNSANRQSTGSICAKKISVGPTEAVLFCIVDSGPCDCQATATELNCTDYNDNDLDGKIDGQDTDCCSDDTDNDGYTDSIGLYNPPVIGEYCNIPAGLGISADDCNDLDPTINPDAVELCDGIDNNCNGIIDDLYGCRGYGMDGTNCEDAICTSNCDGGICIDSIVTDTTECRIGSEWLITMSDLNNAHVVGSGHCPNCFEYSVCYSTNPGGYCPMECKTVTDDSCNPDGEGVCAVGGGHPGWTKILAYNESEFGGSHIIDFSILSPPGGIPPDHYYYSYPQQVLCNASCGIIKCMIGDGTGTSNSCLPGYTCIVGQDIYALNSGNHVSECIAQDYNDPICCKIDYY